MEMTNYLNEVRCFMSQGMKCLHKYHIYCLSGAVVSTSDYESAGPNSISDEGSRRTAHPAVHPPKMGWSIKEY